MQLFRVTNDSLAVANSSRAASVPSSRFIFLDRIAAVHEIASNGKDAFVIPSSMGQRRVTSFLQSPN